MKIFIALMLITLASAANAQTSTVTTGAGAVSGSTSAVIVGGLSGGPGGAAAGGLLGSGILGNVGQTTGGNGVVSYDPCAGSQSFTVGPLGYAGTYKIEECWRYRMMDQMAKYPPGTVQYQAGCNSVKEWREVDFNAGVFSCVQNKAKLAKDDPRAAPANYVHVIAPGIQTLPVNVAQAATPGPPAAPLPLCSRTVTDRCRDDR